MIRRTSIATVLLALLIGCDGSQQSPAQSDSSKSPHIYTCIHCESTRVLHEAGPPFPDKISPDTTDYHSPSYDGCTHEWFAQASRAEPQSVRNGQVILLRKGNAYAAVILTEQEQEGWDVVVKYPARPAKESFGRTFPETKASELRTGTHVERVTYRWVYRADSSGQLDPSDPKVKWGLSVSSGRHGEGIRVEDIQLDWSCLGDEGAGFLYYAKWPGEPVFREDTQFCITDLESFADLDATDPKFSYKGAISDTTP